MVEQVKEEPRLVNPKPPKRAKQTIANLTKQEMLNSANGLVNSSESATTIQATPLTVLPTANGGQVILAQPLTLLTAGANVANSNTVTPVMTTLKLTSVQPSSNDKPGKKEAKAAAAIAAAASDTSSNNKTQSQNSQLQCKRNKQQRLFNTFVRESICQLLGPDYMKSHDVQDIDPQLMEMIRKEAVENYLPENIRPRRAWHLAKASLRTLKRTLNNKKA